MEADRALREAAVSKMDSRVIAALSRDAVAAVADFKVQGRRQCRITSKGSTSPTL